MSSISSINKQFNKHNQKEKNHLQDLRPLFGFKQGVKHEGLPEF